jgi:hypothetical protein
MADWRYVRTNLYTPKSRQRVRLTATVQSPTTASLHNLTDRDGAYMRLAPDGSNLTFGHSPYGRPPFYTSGPIVELSRCSEGRFALQPRTRRLHLLCRNGADVAERTSDDFGVSWSSSSTVFSAATHPDVSCSAWGTTLRAAYKAGAITATQQRMGAATATAAANLKDDAGADLAVEDDVFRLHAHPKGWWLLHVRISGEGTTSLWVSFDDGLTWTRNSGTIGGGTYPGLAVAYDGHVLAWAYKTGNLYVVSRSPGATAAPAAVTVKDTAGAALAVRAGYMSFARSWERPGRWILAACLSTDAACCDFWSADGGLSVTAF